jgi:Arc/MetJ family transcription regulator
MPDEMRLRWWSIAVRTTITLDDDLVAAAQEYTGIQEKSALVRAALQALVQREAARRLARLGGSEPDLKLAPRRRFKT